MAASSPPGGAGGGAHRAPGTGRRRIVVLGVFNADTTYRAARLPRLGETILGEGFALGPGGKGSNQAVAAARAGGDAHILTRVGRDTFGALAKATWAEAGVIPEITEHDEGHTGAAFIFVEDASGDNAIIVAPGIAATLDAAALAARAELVGGAAVFLTQLETPLAAARAGLEIARAGGARTILNPAPAAELDDALLGLCDVITPNETEASALTGLPVSTLEDAERAAAALLARGVGAAVLTLGARGALYRDARRCLHVPAFDAGPVVETTGAGDAFNGALAVALAEGAQPEAAVRFACAAAGLSVTRPGAAASMPTRAQIDAALGRGAAAVP
jgi:ribokinase